MKKKLMNFLPSILGISIYNKGLDSSKQGLVLTSISHILRLASIIKSKPNNSKQYFL